MYGAGPGVGLTFITSSLPKTFGDRRDVLTLLNWKQTSFIWFYSTHSKINAFKLFAKQQVSSPN